MGCIGGKALQPKALSSYSGLKREITAPKAVRTRGQVTGGRRSPAAWSAGGSSTGGTDGSQSTSRSSLCLKKDEDYTALP